MMPHITKYIIDEKVYEIGPMRLKFKNNKNIKKRK